MQPQVKARDAPEGAAASEGGDICWVCGEVATVEVEIRNPTVIPIKVPFGRSTFRTPLRCHVSTACCAPCPEMAQRGGVLSRGGCEHCRWSG